MKPCTPAFPVSIGDRVFSQRLGRAGDVVALQVSEKVGPKAKIEYLNKEGDLKYAWIFCDTLRDPRELGGNHRQVRAVDFPNLPSRA